MGLEDIWNKLSEKMTELQLFQRTIQKMAEEELKTLNKYYKSLEDKPELLELSGHRMLFYDAKTGEARTFGRRKISVEDRMKAVVFHKNKQYQWLLAEAYEAFEDYVEDVYAYAGLLDSNLWPLRDFGNISLSELSNKDFSWFRSQVDAIKKDKHQHILNQFRKDFSDIDNIEIINKFKINLKLAIILIEQLRHRIVHVSGIVGDKDKFIELVLNKAGLYNNGRPKKEYVEFIKIYLGDKNYEHNIQLLEVGILPEIPIDIQFNRFDNLTGYLMAYSYIIAQCLQEHKKKKNGSHGINPEGR
jgi:hypothetical protein